MTYLGPGLLAVLLILGDRGWRELRRQTAYRHRVEERRARAYEDACWAAHRKAEAELAMILWRREWPRRMAGAVRGMSKTFKAIGVTADRTSAAAGRLHALLEGEPEGRV